MPDINSDVVIAGGGLAGLGLATQLINQNPNLNIVVLERNRFPVPDVTAKVGESTVEIGSRYLTHTLGLSNHFQSEHLQKFGLRCFFGAPQTDFSQQDELGVSQRFNLPTFQIARGRVENHLHDQLLAKGVRIDDGVSVAQIDVGDNQKSVAVNTEEGASRNYRSRWLIDTAGRRGLLKSHLNLAKASPHKGNAIWFRVDKTIQIDNWSNASPWQQRVQLKGKRWLSTNHLMGPGYWVWIIPLGGGATSIGMVMDDQAFASANVSHYPDAVRWLAKHHPNLAAELTQANVLDFVPLSDYSYDCQQLFSNNGWAITGEAGVFADPFYSPGADFIALGNEIIAHLIKEEYNGQPISRQCRVLELFFTNFFSNTLSVYNEQYGGFGDRKMMAIKLTWDYTFYWGVLVLLYFKGAVTDISAIRRISPELQKVMELNQSMQALFRQRAAQRRILQAQGMFIDQYKIPVLHEVIHQLTDESLSLDSGLLNSRTRLEQLTRLLTEMMLDDAPKAISDEEREILGDFRQFVLA